MLCGLGEHATMFSTGGCTLSVDNLRPVENGDAGGIKGVMANRVRQVVHTVGASAARDAPRGRRSISRAKKPSRRAPLTPHTLPRKPVGVVADADRVMATTGMT